MSMPVRLLIPALLLSALTACGSVNQAIQIENGQVVDRDLANVNGAIQIGDQCRVNGVIRNVNGLIQIGSDSVVGTVQNVNGAINIGPRSAAAGVESVNGPIALAEAVTVNGSVSTVNGRIALATDSRVEGDLGTTNGAVTMAANSRVEGRVSTVNGSLQLDQAQAGSVEITRGSITLLNASVIEGALRVRPTTRETRDRPRIVIGAGVTVGGPLQFEQPVELFIHEDARVGEISGAEPVRFSGDSP